MKRIFQYLRRMSEVGLIYGGYTNYLVSGYCGSDYAGDVGSRRYITSYAFILGGSVVSWKTTLQPTSASEKNY